MCLVISLKKKWPSYLETSGKELRYLLIWRLTRFSECFNVCVGWRSSGYIEIIIAKFKNQCDFLLFISELVPIRLVKCTRALIKIVNAINANRGIIRNNRVILNKFRSLWLKKTSPKNLKTFKCCFCPTQSTLCLFHKH